MKIVVIGCTESTRRFIGKILDKFDYEIKGIFTLEDSMAGKKSRFVLFDDICEEHNIPLFKLKSIKDPECLKRIREIEPDIILEMGWSQIIPKEILEIPKKGCIGIHYSCLPKNQGGASLNWALIKGEKKWGVTLFHLVEKIDTGDIIDQEKFDVEERDNIKTLFDKADKMAAELLIKNLTLIEKNKATRKKQVPEEVTYLPVRKPEDGEINWKRSSEEIYNLVRGITKPYPGAFTYYKGKKMIIWEVEKSMDKGIEGEVIEVSDRGIKIGTSKDSILIKRCNFENEIESWADEVARDNEINKGDFFGFERQD